ncbi:hypothetical protein LTR17_012106 [Elasticomyces elasticus]|nr:hypothetical protein LTR17_012106 [Elasticomyces elasticus]
MFNEGPEAVVSWKVAVEPLVDSDRRQSLFYVSSWWVLTECVATDYRHIDAALLSSSKSALQKRSVGSTKHRRIIIMADMALTRNVALRPKQPTAEIHTTAIATTSDIPPLLRLPIELHMHILGCLIRQNAHIPMSPQDLAPKKRRIKWERELRHLHDWTPPMKTPGTPAVLLVCSHTCQTFDTFASLARPEAVANITSIELGEGCGESEPLTAWDAKKGEMRPVTGFRVPDSTRPECWPHGDWPPSLDILAKLPKLWPPSLDILAKLPKLRHLKLHAGYLGRQTYVDAEGVNTRAIRTYYGPKPRPRHLVSAHLYRDQALLSIPPKALENLQSLTMYYWMPFPYMIPTKLSADVLSYTKNLHSGAWNDSPFTYNAESRRM